MTEPEFQYEPPVDQLLELGESWVGPDRWPDYPAMGLRPEDVPELIRLATDSQVVQSTSDLPMWGPVHAWRALAQLGAAEAVDPLIRLMREEDDDAASSNLPAALGRIGAPAVEPLIRVLHDPAEDTLVRASAMEGLREAARAHPELRDACVRAIVAQLERFEENPAELNAFLIGPLMDLREMSAVDLMERAYAAGAVDESIPGDWEEVQVALGLREERTTPRPNYFQQSLERQRGEIDQSPWEAAEMLDLLESARDQGGLDEPVPAPRTPSSRQAARAKARKKQEKQSRRKNRRR